MAMEMSCSQSEMVHEQRPIMSTAIFLAAMKGDGDVLMQCLGLPKEQTEVKLTIEASHSAPEQIHTEHQNVQCEHQSATHFGDTVLHLLVTERHNVLALKVFERYRSLLKAQNKMFETPLYCAAKVGNEEVIHNLSRIDPVVVKDALKETNENGDTALHVAAQHGHTNVGRELMKLDPKIAYKINKKRLSPLYIAMVNRYTTMVQTMLEVDPTLACTKFSDGMFPVHVAAHMGNMELVMHFMKKYADYAELLDPRGRNFFHIAIEENQYKFFQGIFKDTSVREMIERMNNRTDYEGNTPLHIAAMKGHTSLVKYIWKNMMNDVAETVRNNEGLTPFELCARQVAEHSEEVVIDDTISEYVQAEGYKFTIKWFKEVMDPALSPISNKWDRAQIIGLGSVLITTVTFAAAFTIPGGYNQDHGTPVLGRRYMFRAFIVANTLAFIQGFISLFVLLANAMHGQYDLALPFATFIFVFASSSMIVAFGLGLYVTLAPVCLPLAILVLVITLFVGSPAVLPVIISGPRYFNLANWTILPTFYAVTFLLIFCLALLL